jgi:hypothetical protein
MKITQTLKIKINKYQYSFTEKSQYLRVAKQALIRLNSRFSFHPSRDTLLKCFSDNTLLWGKDKS